MKIVDISAIPFRLPVRRDFRWAGLGTGIGRFVLIQVRTDTELIGLGEATPLPDWGGDHHTRAGETQQTVAHVVRDLIAPALTGTDPLDIALAHRMMNTVVRGHSYAKAAVDIALHDLLGKAAGLPLYRVLGGAVRDEVQIAHMVGLMGMNDAVREGVAAAEDGVTALQIKGGVDADRDVALIKALRKELPDVLLRLDANQGYGRAGAATTTVRRLVGGGVDWVEQPVEGSGELAELRTRTSALLIADESCWTAHDAIDLVSRRAVDGISIYLAKAGGIHGARAVAAVAEATGLPCDVNGSIESGVGTAANLHFALAMASVSLPCVIPMSAPAGGASHRVAGHYYEDDIIVDPLPVARGALLPTEGPGLGVVLDEDKLERFRDN